MSADMYDSVDVTQIPLDAEIVAYYIDGRYATTEAAVREHHPHAKLLSISVLANPNAMAFDSEPGNANEIHVAAAVANRNARGLHSTIYFNHNVNGPTQLQALAEAHVPADAWSWWAVDWRGPYTPVPAGAAAVQFGDYGGYDQSHTTDAWVAKVWPPPPAPQPAKVNVAPGETIHVVLGGLAGVKVTSPATPQNPTHVKVGGTGYTLDASQTLYIAATHGESSIEVVNDNPPTFPHPVEAWPANP